MGLSLESELLLKGSVMFCMSCSSASAASKTKFSGSVEISLMGLTFMEEASK